MYIFCHFLQGPLDIPDPVVYTGDAKAYDKCYWMVSFKVAQGIEQSKIQQRFKSKTMFVCMFFTWLGFKDADYNRQVYKSVQGLVKLLKEEEEAEVKRL